MPMKKKNFVAMLMVCAVASAAIYSAMAQTSGVLGVKEGDNFTYSFAVFWSATNPSKIVPQEFADRNQTISIHFNVTGVGVAVAYVNISNMMRDGTQTSTPGFVQVLEGRGVDAQYIIIGANLTAGDKAYPLSIGPPSSAESFTIDETLTRTYLGTLRTVNRYSEKTTDADGNYVDRNAYYDRETGVLMEMTIEHYYANLGETYSERWKIVQFNSATAGPADSSNDGTSATGYPDWLLYAVVVVVVVVVAALVAVLVLKRRKTPPAQEPTPVSVPPPSAEGLS